jgi:hypothetical protein
MQMRCFGSSQSQFRPHIADLWKNAKRTSPLKQGSFNKRRFAGHPEIYIALGCVAYAGFAGSRLLINKSALDKEQSPLWSRIWAPAGSGYRKASDESGNSIASNI